MNISWFPCGNSYEILIAVIIGLLIGGAVSYALFYPLYEALRDFEEAYTKECKAIIECYDKINKVQNTMIETLKIQEDTNNKIINTFKDGI